MSLQYTTSCSMACPFSSNQFSLTEHMFTSALCDVYDTKDMHVSRHQASLLLLEARSALCNLSCNLLIVAPSTRAHARTDRSIRRHINPKVPAYQRTACCTLDTRPADGQYAKGLFTPHQLLTSGCHTGWSMRRVVFRADCGTEGTTGLIASSSPAEGRKEGMNQLSAPACRAKRNKPLAALCHVPDETQRLFIASSTFPAQQPSSRRRRHRRRCVAACARASCP
jgi:hypothetical protein